jgi:membrane-associated phospholipid phosphatase
MKFPPFVESFDKTVNAKWETLRGNPSIDRVMFTASEVGDFGVIWMFVAGIHALGGAPRHGRALVRMGGALAFESIVVNQGLKRIFRRERPTDTRNPTNTTNAPGHSIRTPSTSSFPSGHSTSAITAAVLLTQTSPIPAPILWGAAGIVATSRVHVNMHHPSDVVGGVVVGFVVGRWIRRLNI